MKRLLILLLLLPACAIAQSPNYVYPIRNVAGLYSANFGEMRPGHFHAGVDIKTDGAVGRPLVAVANGYISRITVWPGGYGRALYITLHDGRTAVYGHILRFSDALEERVLSERLARRRNEANLWFQAGQFPVSQGDVVAFSGNSGSSFGPHLHYELREAGTQRLLNIVREGIIRPADNIPPYIVRLHYIEVDTLQGVPHHSPMRSYEVLKSDMNTYRLAKPGAIGVGRKGYFVVEATDRRNGVSNTFGVYRVSLDVDAERRFEYRMDGFMPDQARCCDAISYYPLQIASRNEAIRLAQLETAPESFYPVLNERGVVRTEEGQIRSLRIETEDDCGNISRLSFDVKGIPGGFPAQADTTAVVVTPRNAAVVRCGDLTTRIPAGALFETQYCRPEQCQPLFSGTPKVAVISPAYRVFSSSTPLCRPIHLSIRVFIPEKLRSQVLLAVRTRKGTLSPIGGSYANGTVSASTRTTGEVMVVADTLPPDIVPLFTPGTDLTRNEKLSFRIGDDFSGITSCSLHIDGQWVPYDRYPIQSTLEHLFLSAPERREHKVRLSVGDACGNTAEWEGYFYR